MVLFMDLQSEISSLRNVIFIYHVLYTYKKASQPCNIHMMKNMLFLRDIKNGQRVYSEVLFKGFVNHPVFIRAREGQHIYEEMTIYMCREMKAYV